VHSGSPFAVSNPVIICANLGALFIPAGSELKVAQLAGYCGEHTAYHHGEASLHATIVGMAQDFVGANNLRAFFCSGSLALGLNRV
jgi:hypothetical protein